MMSPPAGVSTELLLAGATDLKEITNPMQRYAEAIIPRNRTEYA